MLARLWSRLRASEVLYGGFVSLAFGLSLALSGACPIAVDRLIAAYGVSVEGSVVGKEIGRRRARAGGERLEYRVAYRFATASGAEVAGRATVARALWDRLVEGAPVAVRYLPPAPRWHRVGVAGDGGFARGLMFMAIGGLLALNGGLCVYAARHLGPGPPLRWPPGVWRP